MKMEKETLRKDRKNEKGAAMIMALLISFLLLVASAGLLLEASMNSANVTDAVAEQQAYHAAESGIQSAVHILRCQKNDAPPRTDVRANPLIVPSASPTAVQNQINYTKAVDPVMSSTSGTARDLSRWINYDSTCGTAVAPCVSLTGPASGYAFSLQLSDPDNTSKNVSFSMVGRMYERDNDLDPRYKTYGTGGNTLKITYSPPPSVNNYDMSAGPLTMNYGTFTIERNGGGAVIPANNRFDIVFRMTRPYEANKSIRGWILATTNPNDIPKIIFDSQTMTLAGSAISMDLQNAPSSGWSAIQTIVPPTSEPLMGYKAQPSLGTNNIGGMMTAPEPVRLLIRSTGYGPRGAKKELQAIIQKNFFMGLTAPAALTLVGPHRTGCDGGLPSSPSSSPCTDEKSHFYFDIGDSNVVTYSGQDQVSTDIIPPIGTSNPQSLSCVEDYIVGSSSDAQCTDNFPNGSLHFHGNVIGSPSDISIDLPFWLSNPAAIDYQVHKLAQTAQASGRFYANGVVPPDWGNVATGTGITFCDGDVELGQGITGDGGGLLVVTGKLTLKGSFTFKGLIIVTGKQGIERSGGGTAEITGNVVVAPYQNPKIVDRVVAGVPTDDPPGIALAPRYNISGGGNSNLQFNSQSLLNSLTAISNFVLGVMEK